MHKCLNIRHTACNVTIYGHMISTNHPMQNTPYHHWECAAQREREGEDRKKGQGLRRKCDAALSSSIGEGSGEMSLAHASRGTSR